MKNLKKTVIQFFKQNNLILQNTTIVVAVSAGPDSMALLETLLDLKEEFQLKIIAAHINHQLRDDSIQEGQLLANYNVGQFILEEKSWPIDKHPQHGIEAAARDFRYRFFNQLVEKYQANYLMTAHHGDDLLETMLQKLIRSGNLSEFGALKPVRQNTDKSLLLRPFLSLQKKELENFCQQNSIPYLVDSTNDNDFTIRNRLRHNVVPILKKENPKIISNAVKLNYQIEQKNQILTELVGYAVPVELSFGNQVLSGKVEILKNLSQMARREIIATFARQYFNLAIQVPIEFDRQGLASGVRVTLSKQLEFTIIKDTFYLINYQGLQKSVLFPIELDHEFSFSNHNFFVTKTKNSKIEGVVGSFFGPKDIPLYVGSFLPGQKILLANGQHQQIKKRFAQEKIPVGLRPFCLTIQYQNQASWDILFIDQTYQNQNLATKQQEYLICEVLKKDKKK